MNRVLKTSLVLLLALAASTSSSAGERLVKLRKLDNGLTIIASPNPWNQIVGFAAVVDAGARRDPEDLSGLAQLTNELLGRGVKSMAPEELAEILDRGGMQMSTHASLDWATVQISAMRSDMDAAARIFAEVLTQPALEKKSLLSIQSDALRRIEKRADAAVEDALEETLSAIFADHPYGRLILGTRESVESITVKDVRRFYETNYGADGTVVAVVGDFDADYALDLLEDLLSEYGGRGSRPFRAPAIERQEARTIDHYRDIKRGVVLTGYLTPEFGAADFMSLQLASLILAGGEHTRLARAFDDSRTAGVSILEGQEAGAFVAYALTDDIEPARAKLNRELDRLRTELVTEDELDRAKNAYLVGLAAARERNAEVARFLAVSELFGLGVEYDAKLMQRVDGVTREDVLLAAQRNLVEPVVVIQRPGKKGTRGGI